MTTRHTKVLSAQYSVLSQKLTSLRQTLRIRVRLPSWSAPALRRFQASPHNHLPPRPLSRILSTEHWALSTLFLALFICLTPAHSQALKIELVSEQTAILPGKPFTLGLWLQHPPGAHTYWRSPGIVGVPTQMDWKLPAGWKVTELIYPEPERTFMYQIKAQGFDRNVMLRADITPPADLKPGAQVTLTGRASWMCCGNSCNPGMQDLSITLPVVAKPTEVALHEKWHQLLNVERARAEQPSDAWTATATEDGTLITLTIKPATEAARRLREPDEISKIIAFTEDGWFDSDEPQIIESRFDGTLIIQLTKADAYLGDKPPETLRVIVRNDAGWLQGGKLRCLQLSPAIDRSPVREASPPKRFLSQ